MYERKQLVRSILFFIISLFFLLGLLFAVGIANPIVNFSDEQLEQLVREMLERPTKPIYKTDLKPIMHLDLSGLGIGSIEGLRYFSNLTELNLDDNYIEEIYDITDLTKLTSLSLKNNLVSDLSPLAAMQNLRELDIRNNKILDVEPLKRLTNLERLNLRDNYIKSIDSLSDLKGLEYLNLHSNYNIMSIQPIADLVNLQTLILRDVNVGNDVNVLESMNQLRIINLRNSGIGNEGIEVIGKLPDIVKLDLSENHITNIKPLKNLKNLEEVDICDINITNLEPLSELTGLIYLNLHSNLRIDSLRPLSKLVNLQTLALKSVQVGGYIDILESMKDLRCLDLINCGVQDSDLIIIGELQNIQQLNLSYNLLSDISTVELPQNIRELNLSRNQIIDLSPLSNMYNLKTLNLRYNSIENIDPLSELTGLTYLNLRNNRIQNIDSLSELTGLNYLNLHSNSQIKSIRPLEGLVKLETLILENINVGDDVCALEFMSGLTRLNLSNCHVSHIQPLNNMLNLEILNLRDNSISNIKPLTQLKALTYLNLHSNSQIESIQPLAGLVNLQTLVLRNVHVGEEIEALGSLKALTRLNLRNCGISDTTVLSELLAASALQDQPQQGVFADINLLENDLSSLEDDPSAPIRPYWHNISTRFPLMLPYGERVVRQPTFSHEGGFYENNFVLHLFSDIPSVSIYYTLDGSEPTIKSQLYDEPITIHSREGEPDLLTKIPTASKQYWQKPKEDVFKGTVVRAIVISEDGEQSSIATRTFFIHPFSNERYTMPVISLSIEADYLFDDEIGIYSLKNAENRGLMWERPAHIEFYEPDGTLGFTQNIGVRIHGSWARGYSQKSLRLYASAEYDVKDVFSYEIFPELMKSINGEPLTEFKTLILRNSGNDNNNTMFRDSFMHSLIDHVGTIETQASRAAVLFINGEYWGIHNIRERYDADYLKNHYGTDDNALTILYNNAMLSVGSLEERQDYLDMRNYMIESDLNSEQHYRYIESMIDIQSIIDYYAANIYFSNWDWPQNNIQYYKINDIYNNITYHNGLWSWMLLDTDHGFDLNYIEPQGKIVDDFREKYGRVDGAEANTLLWAASPINYSAASEWPNSLFNALLDNEEFRHRFINNMADHLNSSFKTSHVLKQLDNFQALYEPEIEEHIARWRAIRTKEDWLSNINIMREFAKQRPDFVRSHFIDYFDLSGTVSVTVSTDITKGYVQINKLKICSDTPGVDEPDNWTGLYFKGVPIKITAVPEPGFVFAGWMGSKKLSDTIEIVPNKDLTLTPIFIRE